MIDISQFGKGAIRTPKKIRDSHFRLALSAGTPIDWSKPYIVPDTVPVFNQGSSSACTAFATISYCMALNELLNGVKEEYSRRHIYSQVSIGPNQGAYIWKAMSIPLKGLASEASIPDGLDEQTEIDGSLNANAVIEAMAQKYAMVPRVNIDQMAQVILSQKGFVTGFNGHNAMFDAAGQVVDWSHSEWGHAVRIKGFEMRNGKKCIRFRNSWSAQWGSDGDGFFTEDFVNSGMLYDLYTYAQMTDLDPSSMFKLVQVSGSPEVWLVKNGVRTHVDDATALTIIGEFSQVQQISEADLNAIPLNLLGGKPLGLSATVND